MYLYRMKLKFWTSLSLVLCILLSGCRKPVMPVDGKTDSGTENLAQRFYVNQFAWNVMNTYYLWRDEISAALDRWKETDEPISKVAEIRYKDKKGNDIDRWTMVTDDFSSLTGGVSGHTRTLGMDFQLYYADKAHTRICAVVTYVYAGSPAAEKGLGRGDVVMTVDGREMTTENYQDLVRKGILGGGTVTLGLKNGKSVKMTAVDMYENPVQTVRILDRPEGRRIGYLHFTSFTLDSCAELIDVFRDFTQEGIDELVLDLRYNGGGYITTETLLASMLAPVAEVEAGSVFTREVYNSTLEEAWGDNPTCFTTDYSFKVDGESRTFSTAGANPGLPRLYVLATESSASASECLVCGLRPYMDVILIGNRTSGKYCAGYLMDATDWYGDVKDQLEEGVYEKALPYVDNWGIYVMYSRYADCNGETLSMPDGIAPDYVVDDDPLDGFGLGDPQETMLAFALGLIEGRTRSAENAASPALSPVPDGFHPRTTGVFVGRY